MRNPIRTEAEAFSFVVVIAAVGAAIGIAAWLGGRWAALGVFIGLAIGVIVAIFLRSEPKAREQAVWERPRARDEQRRVLVIANETCAGRTLLDEIRYRARGDRSQVLVVAPALSGHVRFWVSDIDGARGAAKERLDESLAALATFGIDARGEVGDADPVQAIEDALRTFGADEIIISTHPRGRSNWLERDEVARARERFPVPVTHVIVDLEAESARSLEAGGRVSPPRRPA
jgi:hypothetical protein